MSDPLPRFMGGTPAARQKLNRMADELDALRKIRGDEQFITVDYDPHSGVTVKLLINHVIPRIPRPIPGGLSVLWGTLVNPWTPGTNEVTLQPCNGWNDASPETDPETGDPVPPITVYVQFPLAKVAQCLAAATDDILGYVDVGADQPVLFNPPLMPDFRTGNTQYQGVYNASANAGAPSLVGDWLRATSF